MSCVFVCAGAGRLLLLLHSDVVGCLTPSFLPSLPHFPPHFSASLPLSAVGEDLLPGIEQEETLANHFNCRLSRKRGRWWIPLITS